jgi:homoserine dehydrogenase
VRDRAKQRTVSLPEGSLTTNPHELLADDDIAIIVEVMGGETPAVDYIRQALSRGKHVVTANKEVIAKHGPELLSLARSKGVNLLFEASVGGGIPIIGPLGRDLLGNRICSIHAIINGTTNYILTRMAKQGMDFHQALKEAQQLGYAEPDPTNDVEGIDAAYKISILASLAFHSQVSPDNVYSEGISRVRAKDFRYADELGYAIKLLAIARNKDGAIQARVHPVFVPKDHLLAKVDGAFNAIEVEGDLVGRIVFHGLGAGQAPTTSAIMGDLLDTVRLINARMKPLPSLNLSQAIPIKPMPELTTRYYFRLTVADRPGVLAQIARILGDMHISIASVIQKDADPQRGTAEIVIMTHPSREDAVQKALELVRRLDVVEQIDNLIRVEDWPLGG